MSEYPEYVSEAAETMNKIIETCTDFDSLYSTGFTCWVFADSYEEAHLIHQVLRGYQIFGSRVLDSVRAMEGGEYEEQAAAALKQLTKENDERRHLPPDDQIDVSSFRRLLAENGVPISKQMDSWMGFLEKWNEEYRAGASTSIVIAPKTYGKVVTVMDGLDLLDELPGSITVFDLLMQFEIKAERIDVFREAFIETVESGHKYMLANKLLEGFLDNLGQRIDEFQTKNLYPFAVYEDIIDVINSVSEGRAEIVEPMTSMADLITAGSPREALKVIVAALKEQFGDNATEEKMIVVGPDGEEKTVLQMLEELDDGSGISGTE